MSCRVHNTPCRRTPALCSPAARTIPVHRSEAAGTRTVGRLRVRALELSSTESQALIEATRRIKAHGKAGKPREAIKEFANLMNLGVPADTTAATTLVAACCPKMQLARSVFDELFGPQSQGGLKPDSITVAVLIRGYGALAEPDWASITTLLTEVQTTFGIEADLTVYNALLEVCARTNDVQRAEILLERMERSGCAPDDLTMEAVKHKRALRSAVKRLFDV